MTARASESRFFADLRRQYEGAPSILLCRVPELEYASTLKIDGASLDHCCGDGVFASLGWPDSRFQAGCDIDTRSVDTARIARRHARLDVCDAARGLPYDGASFDTIFNNSALEHIADLDGALLEIARVARPGATFAFNVLNHRYFEWWPKDAPAAAAYREWQPFFHAFDLPEWTRRLEKAGFAVKDVRGYFAREAAEVLALLDSEFSGHFFKKHVSKLVTDYQSSRWARFRWLRKIGKLRWQTGPDEGAGYYIVSEKRA